MQSSNQNASKQASQLGQSRAERMESALDEILTHIRTQAADSTACIDRQNPLEAFQHLLSTLDRCMTNRMQSEPVTDQVIDASKLARSILISGGGSRFEPSILLAIREYRMAFDNVARYAAADLPEAVKEDILVRFRQQLDSAGQVLEVLEVRPFVPDVLAPIDTKRHRVVRKVTTPSYELDDLIADVCFPGFEWRDDEGVGRVFQAHVAVYVLAENDAPKSVAESLGQNTIVRNRRSRLSDVSAKRE